MSADIIDALDAISPARLDYEEWLDVGMALHEEGYGCDVWDEWSRRDPQRYHAGECERKWRGFGRSADKVTGGTIFKLALDAGWKPPRRERRQSTPGRVLSWDDFGPGDDPGLDGPAQLTAYLRAVFEPDDVISYVIDSECVDGKWRPSGRGSYTRTMRDVVADVERYSRSSDWLGCSLGEPDPEAGAWIRINPFDGRGVDDSNVKAFRHALVECDEVPRDEQLAAYERLRLPCSAIVDSGGKSVHAIVRVDAADAHEYSRRVAMLYEECRKAGLPVDEKNRNPSRLSRMPGIMRGEHEQRLVRLKCGCESWDEWVRYLDEVVNNDLPPIVNLAVACAKPHAPAPELIHGVLRRGHKMALMGASKSGKSWALLELAFAAASGGTWFGNRCERERVLIFNLEVDENDYLDRVDNLIAARGYDDSIRKSIDVWPLRGKGRALDLLVDEAIRQAGTEAYGLVIIDPLYKVMGEADENSNKDVGTFSLALDRLVEQFGSATSYAHHYAKGPSGQKSAIDRGSGAGTFARDADALITLSEILVTPEDIAATGYDVGPDLTLTAFRAEYVLRSFMSPHPTEWWFCSDKKRGVAYHFEAHGLADRPLVGSPGANASLGGQARKKVSEIDREEKSKQLEIAYQQMELLGVEPTRKNIFEKSLAGKSYGMGANGAPKYWTAEILKKFTQGPDAPFVMSDDGCLIRNT